MASCIFCRIVAGELPATRVHEDADVLAFADLHPQAPTHLVLIPKIHIPRVADLRADQAMVMGRLVTVANQLARQQGLLERGYRLVVNCGPDGGQTVEHVHVHLLGGRVMRWPPG